MKVLVKGQTIWNPETNELRMKNWVIDCEGESVDLSKFSKVSMVNCIIDPNGTLKRIGCK